MATPWWLILVPALLGGAAGSLLTASLTARFEQRRWLRDERLSTYSAFLRHANYVDPTRSVTDAMVQEVSETLARVSLLTGKDADSASAAVVEALTKCRQEPLDARHRDALVTAKARFTAAAHKELGVK